MVQAYILNTWEAEAGESNLGFIGRLVLKQQAKGAVQPELHSIFLIVLLCQWVQPSTQNIICISQKNKLCRNFMNYLPFIATFYFMQGFLCYF